MGVDTPACSYGKAAQLPRVAMFSDTWMPDHLMSHLFVVLSLSSLQTLVKRAKHGDDGMDIDHALMSNIAKRQRFKETDLDPDAEYDYDAGVDM